MRQSQRQRAAASFYRAHRSSYAETCQRFGVSAFDANGGHVTGLDRLLVWLLAHEDWIVAGMGLVLVIAAAILTNLVVAHA